MRDRSGSISIDSKLVSFLYELMRDHVAVGTVEELVLRSQHAKVDYSNGWLALYALDVATRLLPAEEEVTRCLDCNDPVPCSC